MKIVAYIYMDIPFEIKDFEKNLAPTVEVNNVDLTPKKPEEPKPEEKKPEPKPDEKVEHKARPKTPKQNMIESIIDLEHKLGKLVPEDFDKRRKSLSKRNAEDIKSILADLTGKSAQILTAADLREEVDARPPTEKEKNFAVDMLFRLNVMCADVIEQASITAKDHFDLPTDLEGLSLTLNTERKEELRYAIEKVVDEHFQIIKSYMTPMALLLTTNLMAMQSVAVKNLKKKSVKPIASLKKEIDTLNKASQQ